MAGDHAQTGAPRTGERLATGELLLRRTLRTLAAGALPDRPDRPVLAPGPLALVRLAALLASDPETESVSWAADIAAAAGVPDQDLVAVLLTVAACARSVTACEGAVRLAAALGQMEGRTDR